MNKLRNSIEYLANYRAVIAKTPGDFTENFTEQTFGISNFGELIELSEDGTIDNKTNRGIELDKKDRYTAKINHNIRFCSGISRKGCLELSVITEDPDNIFCKQIKALISDCGTFLSLALLGGDFYDEKVLTPTEFKRVLTAIDTNFYKDLKFVKIVRGVIDNLPKGKKAQKISWKQIVTANDEIKDYYWNVPVLNWDLRALTFHLHASDMRMSNNTASDWCAFDYYMNPLKGYDSYHEIFDGIELQKWAYSKEGLGKGKMEKETVMASKAHKFVSDGLKSLIISNYIVNYLDFTNINGKTGRREFVQFYKWMRLFESGGENEPEFSFWTDKFYQIVAGNTYDDMTKFYADFYSVYKNPAWKLLVNKIDQLDTKYVKDNNESKSNSNIQTLSPKKEDMGLFLVSLVMRMRKDNVIGIDAAIKVVIDYYYDIITQDYKVGFDTMPVYEAVAKKHISPGSADARMDNVVTPLINAVELYFEEDGKDRAREKQLRDLSKPIFKGIVLDNTFPSEIKCFPLSANGTIDPNQMKTINLNTLDGLHWLHPNNDDNLADEGFIGMNSDNLRSQYKHLNWDNVMGVDIENRGKSYWRLVWESNIMKYEEMEHSFERMALGQCLPVIKKLSETDLNVVGK